MKRIITGLLFCIILASCSSEMKKPLELPEPNWFLKLGSKYDNKNELQVFEVGNTSSDSIIKFCKEYKNYLQVYDSIHSNHYIIRVLVFFDEKKNYKMTQFPPTSAYSPVDDESKLYEHVRCEYMYNSTNGYSTLDYKKGNIDI